MTNGVPHYKYGHKFCTTCAIWLENYEGVFCPHCHKRVRSNSRNTFKGNRVRIE